MARSVAQIRDSLKRTLASINRSLDLEVGPTYDYLLRPVPIELAAVEAETERIKRYYSPNFIDAATPEEARDFSNNFGTGPNVGAFARVPVIFFRSSAPPAGQNFTVPVGALVSVADGSLIYRVLQTVTMFGSFASTYFNTATNQYEIETIVEAVAPGVRYNVPPDRIRRTLTSNTGFDGVRQEVSAQGGTEPEDATQLVQRVQKKFLGLDRNSMGGIPATARELDPTHIRDARLVKPTDRVEFRRLTTGPALDLYVDGLSPLAFSEEYLATGGETSLPLVFNRTASSVSGVALNGMALIEGTDWVFVPDTSLEYQKSTRASPSITILAPALANDIYLISGVKNDLLDQVQLAYALDDSLFKTDILTRNFLDLNVIVTLEVHINSGDQDEIKDNVTQLVAEYIDPPSAPIATILIPSELRDLIRASIPEVDSVRILEFRRKQGSLSSVETIVPLKNQAPRYDSAGSAITVRT